MSDRRSASGQLATAERGQQAADRDQEALQVRTCAAPGWAPVIPRRRSHLAVSNTATSPWLCSSIVIEAMGVISTSRWSMSR